MRNRWMGAVVLGLILVVPAARLRAEEPGPGMGGKEHHWDVKKMQKELGLTDDQVTKLQTITDSEQEAMKTSMDKNKELMTKLENQVKSKANDTDLQATLDDIRASHKATSDQMEQFRSQKDAILTPTQQAKLLINHMKHMRGMMMHGMKPDHEGAPADQPGKSDTDNNKG
jgi:Spy/CpxP family protein refolding chaperone